MSTGKKIRDKYNETQHKIVSYLHAGITKGKHYFKSKYIAKDSGLSPKEWEQIWRSLPICARSCPSSGGAIEQHDVDGHAPCPVNFLIIPAFFYYAKN